MARGEPGARGPDEARALTRELSHRSVSCSMLEASTLSAPGLASLESTLCAIVAHTHTGRSSFPNKIVAAQRRINKMKTRDLGIAASNLASVSNVATRKETRTAKNLSFLLPSLKDSTARAETPQPSPVVYPAALNSPESAAGTRPGEERRGRDVTSLIGI